MLARLRGLFGGHSKGLAKSRLHFVLVQDRTGLSSDELSAFKKELIGVVEKYFVIDEAGFDIDYRRETDSTTLLINSPIVVRRQAAQNGLVGKRDGASKKDPNNKAEKKDSEKAQDGLKTSSMGV